MSRDIAAWLQQAESDHLRRCGKEMEKQWADADQRDDEISRRIEAWLDDTDLGSMVEFIVEDMTDTDASDLGHTIWKEDDASTGLIVRQLVLAYVRKLVLRGMDR